MNQLLLWNTINFYSKLNYIETESGNKINKSATVNGSQFIVLGGKSIIFESACLFGDLRRKDSSGVSIMLGKYNLIHGTIKPPLKSFKGVVNYYPVRGSDFCFIGQGSVVEAASIGSCVLIGNGVIVGNFSIIKDCVIIEDGVHLPPNSVIPPFSRVRMNGNSIITSELPESSHFYIKEAIVSNYDSHRPQL